MTTNQPKENAPTSLIEQWEKEFDANWNDASFTWNSENQNGLTLARNTRKKIKRFIKSLIASVDKAAEERILQKIANAPRGEAHNLAVRMLEFRTQ